MERFAAKTLVIPFNGESAKFVVMRDKDTGDLIHKTTGVKTTTWADAALAASAHADSGDWLFAIPAMDYDTLYFTMYDSEPATKAVTPSSDSAILYSTRVGSTFTDSILSQDGTIKVSADGY